MSTDDFLRGYLLYFVLPLWLAAGFADWLCHRRSQIELTSGTRESAIHLIMMAEAGVCVLIGLFLEITGLAIAIMIAAWIAHELTSFWDVSYADARRRVTAIEQRVHDYMGVVPLLALSIVMALHWPQVLALVGYGPEPLHLTLELKHNPLPALYLTGLLAGVLLFNILPFAEEFIRCIRHGTERRRPSVRLDAL